MAFSDPQSVTVNAVAQSLPRVSSNGNASVYQKDDGSYMLTISRVVGKRRRYLVRLDTRKIAPDPLASANNLEYTAAVYFVIDLPKVGYTNVELKDVALGLAAWLTSANLLKILGNEN